MKYGSTSCGVTKWLKKHQTYTSACSFNRTNSEHPVTWSKHKRSYAGRKAAQGRQWGNTQLKATSAVAIRLWRTSQDRCLWPNSRQWATTSSRPRIWSWTHLWTRWETTQQGCCLALSPQTWPADYRATLRAQRRPQYLVSHRCRYRVVAQPNTAHEGETSKIWPRLMTIQGWQTVTWVNVLLPVMGLRRLHP